MQNPAETRSSHDPAVVASDTGASSTKTVGATPVPTSASSNPSLRPPSRDGSLPVEIGGPAGPEPTRYGDWERKGRCIDF